MSFIWHCFHFDLSLTFDPLSEGRTKRSPWTLASSSKTYTLILSLLSFDTFCNLIFFDLWPFYRRSDEELTVDTYACLSNTNTSALLLLSFDTFCNLTFFDLWPLIRRSDKEVTVDTFASSSKTTTLTLLLLSFDTFCNLTFLWPMTPLTIGRTKRSLWTLTHVCPIATHWHCYFCHLTHFVIWPFFDLWPLTVGRTKRSPWTLIDVCPTPTYWHCYFCHLKLFVIWPRFLTLVTPNDLWLTFHW